MVSTNFLGLAGDEAIQVSTPVPYHAALLKTQLYIVKVPFFAFPNALNCSQQDRHCSYSNAQQAQHAFSPCSTIVTSSCHTKWSYAVLTSGTKLFAFMLVATHSLPVYAPSSIHTHWHWPSEGIQSNAGRRDYT